jgi:ketosteroid isomerase-like protein
MTRARPRAAVLGGSAEDIEAAFYEAQQHGDIEQLMSCWAQDEDIVCVHPDGPRLLGTGAIRAAFEAIFSHGVVRATPLQVHRVLALASAVHGVVEQLEITLPDGVHHALIL